MTDTSDRRSFTSSSTSGSRAHPPHVVDRALMRAAVEARIGQTIGQRYTLTRLLGVGGMAAVYEAALRTGERVAIKLLHTTHGDSLERRKRFLREAYLANAIGHPGVVRIEADGVDRDGSAFLVMELLEGANVRMLQRRAGGRLDPALALHIADQVLDVLAVAHGVGVTHRDIKPANLFVSDEGRVRVLDFGIAHMRDEVPGMTLQTMPGVLLGTPTFMAPEQLLGCAEVDRRTDLYALGATLYTLLSGEPVRLVRTEARERGDTGFGARPLAEIWPDAPPALAAAVDRALRFQPDARWPDARAMQIALRDTRRPAPAAPFSTAGRTLAGLPLPTAPRAIVVGTAPLTERPAPTTKRSRPRRTAPSPLALAWTGVTVLAVLTAAFAIALYQRSHAPSVTLHAPSAHTEQPTAVPAVRPAATAAPPAPAQPVPTPTATPAAEPPPALVRAAAPSAKPGKRVQPGKHRRVKRSFEVVRDIVDPWE